MNSRECLQSVWKQQTWIKQNKVNTLLAVGTLIIYMNICGLFRINISNAIIPQPYDKKQM